MARYTVYTVLNGRAERNASFALREYAVAHARAWNRALKRLQRIGKR